MSLCTLRHIAGTLLPACAAVAKLSRSLPSNLPASFQHLLIWLMLNHCTLFHREIRASHRTPRLAYEDSESTHRLRDTSESTLRAEVARLQAAAQLGNQDVQVRVPV